MGTWLKDTLTTSTVVAAATTTAVALLDEAENGSATGAINAISHILWGEEATTTEHADARHTIVGATLNAAAVTGWAGLHELLMPRHSKPTVQRALLSGAATAAAAYITDFHVVPKRFTPGFERKLSHNALLAVYLVLALSLAGVSLSRDH